MTGDPAPRRHILTVSVEEYYHGGALSAVVLQKHWERFESRIDRCIDEALLLLQKHGARATFFVLGLLAERNPRMVARIADAGHEVASRGYWPRPVRGMTEAEFAADLDRTAQAIAAAIGRSVLGFRAGRWLRRQDLWILEVLAERGYAYDASVNPILRRFAGAPQFMTLRRHLLPRSGRSLWVVPVSTRGLFGWRLGIGGGNWMRQMPDHWMQRGVADWERHHDEPLVSYFTSWELDQDQPHVTAVSALGRLRQYRNLGRLHVRLEDHLSRHAFTSIADHLGLLAAPVGPRVVAEPPPDPAPPLTTRTPVSVVVPIHNEEDNIDYLMRTLAAVERRLQASHRLEILLVDDGSTDRSFARMQAVAATHANVRLLQQPRNQGVAAAIMAGFRACRTELSCSIDCDCSYDPMELERMLPLIDGYDLVTASPYHPDGQVLNVPKWRLFLSRSLSWCYRRLLGVPLHTWTSCFRVVRTASVRDIELQNGGFLGVAELLLRLLRRGGKVREYPTLLEARLLGVSKMKTLRTIRGHLGMLWQLLRRRLG